MGLDAVPPEVKLRVARVLISRATKGISFKIARYRISGYAAASSTTS